jgi:drug/metabolite transporter (DMT)-like permease
MPPTNAAVVRTAAPHMDARDWLLLMALSLLWGGSFFFAKVAVADIPPLTLVFARVAIAAAVLLAVLRLVGVTMPRSPRLWIAFATMGLLNNVLPFGLLFWGQTQIASGLAAILNAATPIFTAVAAHWLTHDEGLTPRRAIGVLLGFAGVVVTVGLDALQGLGIGVMAQLACLVAALSYALAGIYGRRFRTLPAPAVAAGQLTASALLALPVAMLVEQPWHLPLPGATTFAALGGLALLSTALGYVIYFRILARVGATNLLVVTFLIPVTALLLGNLLLAEPLAPHQAGGFLLIGLALVAIDGRLVTAMWPRPARR